MGDIMDYSYQAEWLESQTEAMRNWLSATWTILNGEEPEQDFLEYIMVMIKTQKTMAEIQAEFGDLGVEETKAKDFAVAIGNRLQEIAASIKSKPAKKIESVVSTSTGSEKRTLGPLRTSRGGEPASSPATGGSGASGGSSRLLQTALQSSRGNSGRAANGPTQQRGGQDGRDGGRGPGQKRSFNDNDNRPDFNRDNRVRRDVVIQPSRQNLQNQPGHPAGGAVGGSAVNDTVQYFEQMNKVAQASGFKNAQEMIASQKEMMALMHGGPVMAPGPMQGFAPTGFPTHPGQFLGGPPPPPGYPPQQFGHGHMGFQGRGGRGFGRGAYGREGWEGGRGRGRGGRGPPPPPAPTESADTPLAAGASQHESAAEAPTEGSSDAVPPPVPADGTTAVEGIYPGGGRGYQGRGGRGRGRGWYPQAYDPSGGYGRFGRGFGRGGGGRFYNNAPGMPPTNGDGSTAAPAPTGHKTWVRTADLDNPLVTGR